MKKLVWTFGLIAGLICSVWMLVFLKLGKFEDFDYGVFYGYASMIIAFSMIFVAIKSYRDKHLDGKITFKTAFVIGLYITLITSTFYVVTWLYCYFNYLHDFGDKYVAYTINKMKLANAPQIDIDKYIASMKNFSKTYDNPLYNALLTYTEIIPVGLLVTLICGFILKKKK